MNTPLQNKLCDSNVNSAKTGKPKKPPKKITEQYLRNAGMAYLERFPASTAQFERVMIRKIERSCNYHKEQSMEDCRTLLSQSITHFGRLGLLNDEAYLKGMITSLTRRGLSRQALVAKLSLKGFSRQDVEAALQMTMDEDGIGGSYDLIAALRHARRKKLGPFRKASEFDKTKELSAFARAGFDFETAQRAIKTDLEAAQSLLSDCAL
jgi:regulatory protein